jgi:hypothetical protein
VGRKGGREDSQPGRRRQGQKAKANITLKALIDAGHFKVEERPNPASRGSKCKHLVPADPMDEGEAED